MSSHIDAEAKERTSLRLADLRPSGWRAGLQSVGYALYCAWTFFLSFKIPALCPSVNDPNALFIAYYAASTLAGLALVLAARRLRTPLASRPGICAATGALCVAGALLVTAGFPTPGAMGTSLSLWGFALLGFSSIFLVSIWLEAFMCYGLGRVVQNYLIGMCLGALLYSPLSFCPTPVTLVACAVLPCASLLSVRPSCTFENVRLAHDDARSGAGDRGEKDESRTTRTVVRLLIVVALVSLSVTVVRSSILDAGLATLFYGSISLLPAVLQAAASILAKVIVRREYAARTVAVFYVSLSALALCSLSLLSPSFIPAVAGSAFSLTVLSGQLVSFLVVFRISEEHDLPGANSLTSIAWLNVTLAAPAVAGLVLEGALDATTLVFTVMLCALASSFVVMGDTAVFSLSGRTPAGSDNLETRRRARVEQVAQRFGLTPREQEVLELWGSGHSSPYIERQLSITKNTVKTHTAHIYAKTGTSSKEELVQLIDSADDPCAT